MEMRKAWYPLALSSKLHHDNVIAAELFGEPLVLFRDGEPSGRAQS
jgi:phenylpropionate dioxygenase-like ring-hydroxylating dioxygenase large terminal subunit